MLAGRGTTLEVSTDYWTATVPDTWQLDADDSPALLADPDGVGALQISVAFKDTPVVEADIRDFAKEHLDAGAEPRPHETGALRGFSFAFEFEGVYWRHWYLFAGSMMVYATYNSDETDRAVEAAHVDAIVNSITPITDDAG